MKKKTASILLGILGVCILLVVVGVGVGAWFFASAFDNQPADEDTAARAFDEVRLRFGAVTPILEIRDREMTLLRKPPDNAAPARPIETVHMLAWAPDEQNLSKVAVPMWLLRMSNDPIELSAGSDLEAGANLSITAAEIERYGPTLVVDHQEPNGERFLVWTD